VIVHIQLLIAKYEQTIAIKQLAKNALLISIERLSQINIEF
jgi:hypothetical protein